MLGLMSFTTLSLKVLGSSVPALAAELEPVKLNNNRKNKECMIKQIEMVRKRQWFLSTATLVGVLSVTGAANAASMSYNSSLSTVAADGTPYDSTTTPSFGPPVPRFDPSLGTLQSVVVDLSGTDNGTVGYRNNSARQSANINGYLGALVSLNETSTNNQLAQVSVSHSPQSVNVPRSGSGTLTFSPVTNSATQPFTDPTTLGLFTGPSGSVSLTLTPSDSSSIAAPATVTLTPSNNASRL